jgi:hypothetical protein
MDARVGPLSSYVSTLSNVQIRKRHDTLEGIGVPIIHWCEWLVRVKALGEAYQEYILSTRIW